MRQAQDGRLLQTFSRLMPTCSVWCVQPDLDSMTAHAIRALGKAVKLALTTNYDGVLSTVLGRTMTSPAAVLQRWGSAVDYVTAGEALGAVARHKKELIQLHGSVYDKG